MQMHRCEHVEISLTCNFTLLIIALIMSFCPWPMLFNTCTICFQGDWHAVVRPKIEKTYLNKNPGESFRSNSDGPGFFSRWFPDTKHQKSIWNLQGIQCLQPTIGPKKNINFMISFIQSKVVIERCLFSTIAFCPLFCRWISGLFVGTPGVE